MNRPIVLGVLASGRGTNLQAIIDAIEDRRLEARLGAVISDNPSAGALERAHKHGIPAVVVERAGYRRRREHEEAIVAVLQEHRVDLVCLAGYMRLAGETLLSAYPMRVMNIHPALLPAFPGLEAQRQAFDYGVKVAGCTVHFVDSGVDSGPIIIQRVVPVLEGDDAESLAQRILEQEHQAYPEAIALFAAGRLRLDGRRVHIDTGEDVTCQGAR